MNKQSFGIRVLLRNNDDNKEQWRLTIDGLPPGIIIDSQDDRLVIDYTFDPTLKPTVYSQTVDGDNWTEVLVVMKTKEMIDET